MLSIYLKRLFFKLRRKNPAQMEMVEYWKTKDKVQAKLMRAPDGSTLMQMEGEKYAFPGFPRGHILYGKLSKLKHEVKNQIFNDAWAKLENGASRETVVSYIENEVVPRLGVLLEESRYDLVPPQRMSPAVRELHRAWTQVSDSENSVILRDIFCFVIQDDDAYRFRVQWVAQFFKPRFWGDNLKRFEKAMQFMEHAEVIDDMKERQRLWRRILLTWFSVNRDLFEAFVREVDWKKVRMTEQDKFFFRGKYFKVDFDKFEY